MRQSELKKQRRQDFSCRRFLHILCALAGHGLLYDALHNVAGQAAAGITAFPTTFMITAEGDVFGYASGSLTGDIMDSIVQQTMTGKRA